MVRVNGLKQLLCKQEGPGYLEHQKPIISTYRKHQHLIKLKHVT